MCSVSCDEGDVQVDYPPTLGTRLRQGLELLCLMIVDFCTCTVLSTYFGVLVLNFAYAYTRK